MYIMKAKARLAIGMRQIKAKANEIVILLRIKLNKNADKIATLKKEYENNKQQQMMYKLEAEDLFKSCLINTDDKYKQYVLSSYTNSIAVSKDFVAYDENVNVDLKEQDVKLIAFYLPQFHAFKENDEWWGKGFTEWSNVTRAVPQFVGHYQPQLPIDVGFYNACMIETQKRQIELAKQHGVYGFCFYHYWFSGKRLMEKPVDIFLQNEQELYLPFCLCWANENWARTWDGKDNDILIAQQYLPDDDVKFIEDIKKYILDSRYIRIDSKPLLLVYCPQKLPDAKRTFEVWRRYCMENDIGEIYIAAVKTGGFNEQAGFGVDAAVEFPPHNIHCPRLNKSVDVLNPSFKGSIWSIKHHIDSFDKSVDDFKTFKGVFPSWDNTARKPNAAHMFIDASPETYREWLRKSIAYTKKHMTENEQFVFINAWNEWAEGAHLEPDRKYGYAYLQETAKAVLESKNK